LWPKNKKIKKRNMMPSLREHENGLTYPVKLGNGLSKRPDELAESSVTERKPSFPSPDAPATGQNYSFPFPDTPATQIQPNLPSRT
jgi:hypothetical protein